MNVLPFNPDTLKEAVSILKKGGVVAHPADTCFGLAGDLMNPKALEKIRAIKGRDSKKPMSIMISVPEQIRMKDYVTLDDFSAFVAFKLFPSPVTLVLPKGPKIPSFYYPETDTIGLRVPLHDLTQDLLRAFGPPGSAAVRTGGALITTSANLSGQPILHRHEDLKAAFAGQSEKPDLVIEGHLKECQPASTVIEIKKDCVHILRKGPITAKQLQSILGVTVAE